MKKISGIMLFTAGLVGSFIFGMDVYQNTESVNVFGSKITLSQADWNPLIISLGITIIGIILISGSGSQTKSPAKKKRK